MRHVGPLYRALNPVYAQEPLSGRGAALHGGRFNRKGVTALYTSLSALAAIREANQVGRLQPTTLVSYDAEIEDIFDGRDAGALAAFDTTPDALAADDWRDTMKRRGVAPTQRFADRLIDVGHARLLVPSYAQGSTADDLNLVLWRWGENTPHRLAVIDDERRLGR